MFQSTIISTVDAEKIKQEPDQSHSSDVSYANDSGFYEPMHLPDDIFNYGNVQAPGTERKDTGLQGVWTGSDGRANCQNLSESPSPRSSTPNRVEIFIDENWNSEKKENDDTQYSYIWPQRMQYYLNSREDIYTKKNTYREKTTTTSESLHDSTSLRNNCKPLSEKYLEDVIAKDFETNVVKYPIFSINTESQEDQFGCVAGKFNTEIKQDKNLSLIDNNIIHAKNIVQKDKSSYVDCQFKTELENESNISANDNVPLHIKREPQEKQSINLSCQLQLDNSLSTRDGDIVFAKKETQEQQSSNIDHQLNAELEQDEISLSASDKGIFILQSEVKEEKQSYAGTEIDYDRNKLRPDDEEIARFPTTGLPSPERLTDNAIENDGDTLPNAHEEVTTISKYNTRRKNTQKRTFRKSKKPRRSPTKTDPRFKGATIWLQTEYKDGRSRLNISAFYSNVKAVYPDPARRRQFDRRMLAASPDSYSFSDTEDNSTPPYGREPYLIAKACASCRTRRTPLWRDAEDGTPLCNACGIRYKKYRLRCSKCWHIPKKDIKTYPNCPTCGASLRYSFSRRTW